MSLPLNCRLCVMNTNGSVRASQARSNSVVHWPESALLTKGLFWENWTKMPIETKAISVCKNNIERLLNEYQPELYEAVKKKGTY